MTVCSFNNITLHIVDLEYKVTTSKLLLLVLSQEGVQVCRLYTQNQEN